MYGSLLLLLSTDWQSLAGQRSGESRTTGTLQRNHVDSPQAAEVVSVVVAVFVTEIVVKVSRVAS